MTTWHPFESDKPETWIRGKKILVRHRTAGTSYGFIDPECDTFYPQGIGYPFKVDQIDFYMLPTDPTNQPDVVAVPSPLPIETAPRDGRYVLVFGPSGFSGTPLRADVCRYDSEYPKAPWRDHANDAVTESGAIPVSWLPLPKEDPTQ